MAWKDYNDKCGRSPITEYELGKTFIRIKFGKATSGWSPTKIYEWRAWSVGQDVIDEMHRWANNHCGLCKYINKTCKGSHSRIYTMSYGTSKSNSQTKGKPMATKKGSTQSRKTKAINDFYKAARSGEVPKWMQSGTKKQESKPKPSWVTKYSPKPKTKTTGAKKPTTSRSRSAASINAFYNLARNGTMPSWMRK